MLGAFKHAVNLPSISRLFLILQGIAVLAPSLDLPTSLWRVPDSATKIVRHKHCQSE